MRVGRFTLGLLVAAIMCAPVLAQTSEEELSRVQADLDRLEIEAQELAAEYQEAWAAGDEIQTRISQLESSIAGYGVELRRLQGQVRDRAIDLYMDSAAGNDLASLLLSASPTDLETRSEYLDDIRQRDQVLFNGLDVLTRRLEDATEGLRRDKEEQERVLIRLDELAADLNERLEAGQAAYMLVQQRLAEERARAEAEERARLEAEAQARAEAEARALAEAEAIAATSTTAAAATPTTPPTTAPTTTPPTTAVVDTVASVTNQVPVTDTTLVVTTVAGGGGGSGQQDQGTGSRACPVDGFNTFSDTWGAPRSGGRSHEGVDFLAARGTPVVAVEDGVIDRTGSRGLGGITVWLRGLSGDWYYYAHLDARATGLSAGQMVSRGQPLGIVGTTGNAPANVPHLHWEYHPGGGRAVNPTPLARELCR